MYENPDTLKVRFFIDGISFAHISDCYYLEGMTLHGHNVEVFLEAFGPSSFPFEELLIPLKKEILSVIRVFEHKTIFPQDFLVETKNGNYVFEVFGEKYVLPTSDVLLLPGTNVGLSRIVAYFGSNCKNHLSNFLFDGELKNNIDIESLQGLSLVFSFENNVQIKYFFNFNK